MASERTQSTCSLPITNFYYKHHHFLLQALESEEKEDTHAFIRYGGNGEVYPPPTPTRPLGITRPLPDITPTRLRPN